MDTGAKTVAGPDIVTSVNHGRVKRVPSSSATRPRFAARATSIRARSLLSRYGSFNPTLAMIAVSIRAPVPVEGVVMRLLAEWTAADERSPPRSRSGSRRVRGQTDSGHALRRHDRRVERAQFGKDMSKLMPIKAAVNRGAIVSISR
jgi:hypothetical protein